VQPPIVHIKLELGGLDQHSRIFSLLFLHSRREEREPVMVYYSDDSEQYTSWQQVGSIRVSSGSRRLRKIWMCPQLQNTQSKEGFTTEALALASQYEVRDLLII
jgi:hypothetical protein